MAVKGLLGLPGPSLPQYSCCRVSLPGRGPWGAWPQHKLEGGFQSSAAGALGHLYPQKLESGRHVFSSASPQKFAEFCGFCVGFLLWGSSEGRSQWGEPQLPLLKLTSGLDVCSPRPSPLSVLHSSSPSNRLGMCGWPAWRMAQTFISRGSEHFLRNCPQPEVATPVCSQLQWGKGYPEASRWSPGFQTYWFLSLLCKNSLLLLLISQSPLSTRQFPFPPAGPWAEASTLPRQQQELDLW